MVARSYLWVIAWYCLLKSFSLAVDSWLALRTWTTILYFAQDCGLAKWWPAHQAPPVAGAGHLPGDARHLPDEHPRLLLVLPQVDSWDRWL